MERERQAEARPPDERPTDERERTVIKEANAHGLRVAVHCLLALALITALLGNWLIPAALLTIMMVSARMVRDYAVERHVDVDWLSERSGPLVTKSRGGMYVTVATVVVLAAMSFTGFTGRGLLQGPEIVGTGPEADALLQTGAQSVPLGMILGLVVAEVAAAVKQRRRPQPRPDDVADED